mgnify:CR=1 FL=1|tara:strand:+ start:8944 stop:9123 length:180 start_codon:yes stop_codon:yes gene_type:complete
MSNITKQVSKNDFKQYKVVQESGDYNMLDRRARELTSLSKDTWFLIVQNYSELNEAYSK